MIQLDEWHGVFGMKSNPSEGYSSYWRAGDGAYAVVKEMSKKLEGIRKIQVEIVDRYGDGRFWIHNTSTYEPEDDSTL